MNSTYRPIVTTRLSPPRPRRDPVARPHLLARLNDALSHRLTIVAAPAGYGKTTLVAAGYQGLRSKAATGWLTLDTTLGEARLFLRHVIAAIRVSIPNFGEASSVLISAGIDTPIDTVVSTLVNELATLPRDLLLVLDDYHEISGTPAADAFKVLLDRAPAGFHALVASREEPDLSLARRRERRDLLEIGPEAMRFSAWETADFIRKEGIVLGDGDVAALDRKADGWIAGLQLMSIAMRGHSNPGAVIRSLTGGTRAIAGFFADEVLGRQTPEIQDFLLRSSVLSRLSVDLCDDALAISDSRDKLRIVEASNLFLVRLDDDGVWFKYHPIFAEFLYKRFAEKSRAMDAEAVKTKVCRRAALWCRAQGLLGEAVAYAQEAGDARMAAQVLDAYSERMFAAGDISTLMDATGRLPAAILAEYPSLQLDQVYAHLLRWDFVKAREILATVTAGIAAGRYDLSGDALVRLRAKAHHREAVLGIVNDHRLEAEPLVREWLSNNTHTSLFDVASLRGSLLYVRQDRYDFRGYRQEALEGRALMDEAEALHGRVWQDAIIGPGFFLMGETAQARQLLEEALATARRIGGDPSPLAAMPGLLLADVLYEMDEVDSAAELIDRFQPVASSFGLVEQLIAAYVTRARIAFRKDGPAAAERLMQQGEAVAVSRGFHRLTAHILAERVREALLRGDNDVAERWVRDEVRLESATALSPGGAVGMAVEPLILTRARLARVRGQDQETVGLLRKWVRYTHDRGAMLSFVRFSVALAGVLQLDGNLSEAGRVMRAALKEAGRSSFVRSVLDEGPSLFGVVHGSLHGGNELAPFAERLCSAMIAEYGGAIEQKSFDGAQEDTGHGERSAVEPLTAREIEILRLLSSGFANKEIAETLGLSPATVKWYLQQVYAKLGVHRRAWAVRRARQLGLLPIKME